MKAKSKKIALYKIFFISAVVFSAVSFLGPYQWKVYDGFGLFYFYLVNILFFAGLVFGYKVFYRNRSHVRATIDTEKQKFFLLGISVISTLLAVYEIYSLVTYYGEGYMFLSGQYLERDQARTLFDRVAVVGMQFGTASYILFSFAQFKKTPFNYALAILGLFACGIYYLCIGNRFTLAAELIIFLVCWRMRQGKKQEKTEKAQHISRIQKIAIVVLVVVVSFSFLAIFGSRNHTEVTVRYEFVPGDQQLKEGAVDLYDSNPNIWDPLFMLVDYMGEAPFIFSGIWDNGLPEQTYWFVNTLRPIAQFGSVFGLPSYPDIVAEVGGPAKYSGIVFALIVDFGVILAPFVAFLFGVLFSYIESRRRESYLALSLYPCLVTCCIFAPIYYFNVGRIDFVVLVLLVIYPFLGLLKDPFRVDNRLMKSLDSK